MATIAERNVLIRFNTDARKAKKDISEVRKGVGGLSNLATQAAGTFAGLFAFDIAQSTIQGITAFGKGAAQAAINFEQTQVAFETFLGSAEKANQVLAELQEFSTLTPFEPEQVISAGQSLLAFGVSAEDLTDTLRVLGDISAGTGTDFNELAQIFGKAKVQGRLFAEDINQLTGRGIPIIGEFAKQFGVADSEVKKLVESGKIGFPQLEQAFQNLTSEGGKFFELTAKQSQTVGGRISTLVGNFNEFQKELGQRLLPVISTVVDRLSGLVGSARQLTQVRLSEEFQQQRIELLQLTNELQQANISEDRRIEIINQLKTEYPDYLGQINAEKVTNEELIPILNQVNQALIERIALEVQAERVLDARNKVAANLRFEEDQRRKIEDLTAKVQARLRTEVDLSNKSFIEQAKIVRDQAKADGVAFLARNDLNGAIRFFEEVIQPGGGLSKAQDELNKEISRQAELQSELTNALKSTTSEEKKTTDSKNEATTATSRLSKEEVKRLNNLTKLAQLQEKLAEEERQRNLKRIEDDIKAQNESDKLAEERRKEVEEDAKKRNELTLQAQKDFNDEVRRIERENREQTEQDDIEQAKKKQELREKAQKKELEAIDKIVAANQAAAQAINQIGQALFGQQIERLDRLIDEQQKAVDKSLESIERGGAEQVQLEENRLAELQNQRDRAAQQLRITTAIEVAANQAAAVASGIAAVAEAFRGGNVIQGVITSAALAATIAGSTIAIRNAFSDIPGFAEGTEFFDGAGGTKSDSNIARISRGERIVPADMNAAYFDTLNEFQHGTPMADLLHGIATGKIPMPMVSDERQAGHRSDNTGAVIGQLERLNKKFDRLEMNVTLDKNGFAASMSKYTENKNKFRRKING